MPPSQPSTALVPGTFRRLLSSAPSSPEAVILMAKVNGSV
jgi:hypothetical protein